MKLQNLIEKAWNNRSLLKDTATIKAIRRVIDLLDNGELRVAEPTTKGWQVNEWIKKAVVLYFPIQKMEVLEAGIFEYHDKIPLKNGYKEKGVLHTRKFIFEADHIVIKDMLKGAKSNTCVAFFHFHPKVHVQQKNN